MKNLFKKIHKSQFAKYFLGFLILLGIFILYQNFSDKEIKRSPLIEFDTEKLEKILIQNKDSSIELGKTRNDWTVSSKGISEKADQIVVSDLISSLKNTVVTNTASIKDTSFPQFGVTENDTSLVLNSNDGKSLSFYLGNEAGYSQNETYARLKDSAETIIISPNLKSKLKFDILDWKDRTIISIPKENIDEIKFKSSDMNLTLSKKDGKWTHDNIQNKEPEVSESKLENILNTLSNFRAHSITKDDFKKIEEIISIKTLDKKYTISFGSKRDDGFIPVKISDNNEYIFLIYKFAFDNVFPKLEDILKEKSQNGFLSE